MEDRKAVADLAEILLALRSCRSDLEVLGVTRIGVYGSFLRGLQRQDSDVDILFDHGPMFTLFDLVGVGDYLEALLGRQVDLLEVEAARRSVYLRHVLDEAEYAFE